jgi:outer membrane cobalamin receptor
MTWNGVFSTHLEAPPQQTAVIWNGININSQLLGQTDFNTITTQDFNSIVVRAGGGSAIYGTKCYRAVFI